MGGVTGIVLWFRLAVPNKRTKDLDALAELHNVPRQDRPKWTDELKGVC